MIKASAFLFLAIALLTATSVGLQAQPSSDPIGVLDLGMGARALGMGGAFAAIAADGESLFYNPAGLAFVNVPTVEGYVARPFNAFDHLGVQLTAPSVGVGVVQYGVAGLPVNNAFGNPTGQTQNFLSRAVVLGGGAVIGQGLALGARLNLSDEENGPVRGSGWGLDLGLLYRAASLGLGVVAGNALSDDVEFNSGKAIAGRPYVRGGVALHAVLSAASTWRVALDGVFRGEALELHLGTEVDLGALSLRLGWDRGLWTAGASVRQGKAAVHIAYALHAVLPPTLRLSAAMAF